LPHSSLSQLTIGLKFTPVEFFRDIGSGMEFEVRSPTGRTWIGAVLSFVIAGELFYEVRQNKPAELFKTSFTDAELIPWIVVFAMVALVCTAWLVILYVKPGRLRLDLAGSSIRRSRPQFFRTHVFEAPASEWKIHVVFFSEEQHDRGIFKRIEILGPGIAEVLLLTDIAHPEELVLAIEQMGPNLGKLDIEIEQ